MDSSICVKPVHKPNSKIFSIPDEHSLHCNDRLDSDDPNRHIAYTYTWQDLSLKKKNRKREKKLDKLEIRNVTLDFQNEVKYLWNSDPSKQAKGSFDSGEIRELTKPWEREATIRDPKRGIVRVSTGRPVYWSEPLGKWVDLAKEDRSNWK